MNFLRTSFVFALVVCLAGCAARPRMAAEYSQDGSGEKPRQIKKQTRYTLIAQSDSTVQYNRGALLGSGGAVATNYEPDDLSSSDDDDFLPRSAADDEFSLADAEGMPDRSITQEEGRGMPDGQQGQEPYVADNEGEQLVPGASASDSLRSSFDLDQFANAEIEPMDPKDLPSDKKEVTSETASQAVQQSGTSADVKSAIAQMEQAADQQKEVTGRTQSLAQTLQEDATAANAPTEIQGLPVVTSETKTESALEEVAQTKLADGKTETTRTILPSETETSTAEAPGPVEMTVPEVSVGADPTKAQESADAQLAGEMQNMAGEAGTTPPPEAPVDLPVAQKGAPAQEQVVPDDPASMAKEEVTSPEPAETLAGKEEEVLPPESKPSTLYPDDTAPPGVGDGPSTASMQEQLQNMISTGAEETAESAAGASISDAAAETEPLAPEAVTDQAMESTSAVAEAVPTETPTVEAPSVEVPSAPTEVVADPVNDVQETTAEVMEEATTPDVTETTKPEEESLVSDVTEVVESTSEDAMEVIEETATDVKEEVEASVAKATASTPDTNAVSETMTAASESVEKVASESSDAAEGVMEETKLAMRDDVKVPALDEMASTATDQVKEDVEASVEETVTPTMEKFRGEEVRTITPPNPMPDDVAVISTRLGDIVIQLDGKAAPQTVTNFKQLAEEGFFNRTTFHRVIPHFIIQGGDPLSKDGDRQQHGEGGPGYVFKPEISGKHKRGAVAAARLPDDVNPLRYSNGSQFYICVVDAPSLDGKNTVFGRVIKGMEVVDKIAVLPRDDNANPLRPLRMDVKVMSREDWEKN